MNKEKQVFFNNFLENAYSIFDFVNLSFLHILKSQLVKKLSSYNLEILNKLLNYGKFNNERIRCYGSINKINNWEKIYFSFASNKLNNLFLN